MTVIFNLKNKGRITQGFMQNLNPSYAAAGLAGHTGVDSVKGYGQPIIADNDGVVYKIIYHQQSPSNWQAVYMLVPYPELGPDCFMEILSGHLSQVNVQIGQRIKAGDVIGLEGNFGTIYSNGVAITALQENSGDHRGSHEHCQFRPVRLIRSGISLSQFHYLDAATGGVFKDSNGVYQVYYENPATNGCVDPMAFVLTHVAVPPTSPAQTQPASDMVEIHGTKFTMPEALTIIEGLKKLLALFNKK